MDKTIAGLGQQLNYLQDQIRKLATAQRANNTTVRGGSMHWQPPDPTLENPQLWIGNDAFTPETQNVEMRLYDGDGNNVLLVGTQGPSKEAVIRVDNPDQTRGLIHAVAGKMIGPLVPSAWQQDTTAAIDASGRPTTTSATYTALYRTLLPILSGSVWTEVDVVPGAGNTVDARIIAQYHFDPVDTVVWEQTGVVATTRYTIEEIIPDELRTPPSSPIGSLARFELQVRRTAGAGAITAAPVYPIVNVT